jgi:CheY-like chemotaxis protein
VFRERDDLEAVTFLNLSMDRKKILVVDDSPVIRKTLSFKLNLAGYDVLTAIDGSDAVSVARLEKPDLILLDIGFPPDVCHGGGVPWDGFLIMDWLKRLEDVRLIPTIIITGNDTALYQERAMAAGAVSFFQKPIDHAKLLAVIRQILGQTVPATQPTG